MKVLLLQNNPIESFGCYLEQIEARDIRSRLVHVYAGEALPATAGWDAVIVGGTPESAMTLHRHSALGREVPYLRELVAADIPIFGVCCGGQVLAMILGGSVERLPAMEIGLVELELTDEGRGSDLLAGFPRTFPAFEWHADVFVPPPGAQTLIGGGAWRAQAYQSGLNVGVLFHLEYGIDGVERWAEAYANELAPTGLMARDIVEQCMPHAEKMQSLGRRLMGNYLDMLGA